MTTDSAPIARVPLSRLTVGKPVRITHPPYDILVVHTGSTVVAVEDACPHSGRSLSEGIVQGDCVVCPGHGWQVHLLSGKVRVGPPSRSNPVYRIAVEGDEAVVYAPAPPS